MTSDLPAQQSLNTDAAETGSGLRGIALVFTGGTAGTWARYGLDLFIGDTAGLPLSTFIINITGAFALGVLIESLTLGGLDRRRRNLGLLLGAGLLGGYTTYSLLATDIAALVIDHRVAEAIGYGLATLLIGGLASWTGIVTARTRKGRS